MLAVVSSRRKEPVLGVKKVVKGHWMDVSRSMDGVFRQTGISGGPAQDRTFTGLFSYEFLPNRSYFAHQLPLCSFRVPVSYIPLSGYCCLASYSLYSR